MVTRENNRESPIDLFSFVESKLQAREAGSGQGVTPFSLLFERVRPATGEQIF